MGFYVPKLIGFIMRHTVVGDSGLILTAVRMDTKLELLASNNFSFARSCNFNLFCRVKLLNSPFLVDTN